VSSSSPIRAESYVDFGWSSGEFCESAKYVDPQVFDLAGDLVRADARVLDMGCGNGALAGAFLKRGCYVVGVDLSAEGIAIARRMHPEGRFEQIAVDREILQDLGEEPFDLVVSTEVIEHLYAPQNYLIACREALRPGGRCVISTPYHGYLKNVMISVGGKFDFHVHPNRQGGHIKFWSRKTLTTELQEAGFTNIRFRGAGRLPLLWKSMVMSGDRPGV